MSIIISNANKTDYVNSLSQELRNAIMIEVETHLNDLDLESEEFQKSWDDAFNSKVCDLEDTIDIEFVDDVLSYYVIDNLRSVQDGMGSFKLERFDKLDEAIDAFNKYPDNYTAALGGSLGSREIDFVHRKNGINIQVNDFKFIEHWNNPLVDRATKELIYKLDIEYESDLRMFNKTVLIPIQEENYTTLNSYFMDKYLRPRDGVEKEIRRKYGDPNMYGPTDPMHYEHLYSAVNEVFVPGNGWMKAEKFFKKLDSISECDSPERLKVMKLNINYVDLNGRVGQADINPNDFALLKKQTIERTAEKPSIEEQIKYADAIKQEQIAQAKNKTKDKSKGQEQNDYTH